MIDNECIQFSCGSHSYYLPALIVRPTGSLGKKCSFYLRVVPESNVYSLHKFSISENNIDNQWYFKNIEEEDGRLLSFKNFWIKYIFIIFV